MSRPTRPVDIDDDMELVRLRAREEQARDIINALLPSTFGADRDRRTPRCGCKVSGSASAQSVDDVTAATTGTRANSQRHNNRRKRHVEKH